MTGYFDVRVERTVDYLARVPVIGKVDISTSDVLLQVLLGALTADGTWRVEVDLTKATLLDASGVGVLLDARRQALARDKELRVRGATGLALQVLEITGVLGLLDGKGDTEPRNGQAPDGHDGPGS